MTANTPVAVRVYGLLLKAYPAEFRGRYADQMLCFFEESWLDVSALSSPAAALMLWLHTLDDLLRTALYKRMSQFTGRIGMQRGISLGASAALHVIILWALTWLAFHPLPPPEGGCLGRPSRSIMVRTAVVPTALVDSRN
jgi:hypothetical protein